MRIQVHFKGMAAPADLLSYVQRRTLFALGRYGQRIRAAHISLGLLRDPQGHEEQYCDVQVDLLWGTPIVVHEQRISLEAAASAALERAERTLARRVDISRASRTPAPSTRAS